MTISIDQEPTTRREYVLQNRKLSAVERSALNKLLDEVRDRLGALAGDDQELRFALNRRLFVELMHDERVTPVYRHKLKVAKLEEQKCQCAICGEPVELEGSELDRTKAGSGYTKANTRLVHPECHRDDQKKKKLSDLPSNPPA